MHAHTHSHTNQHVHTHRDGGGGGVGVMVLKTEGESYYLSEFIFRLQYNLPDFAYICLSRASKATHPFSSSFLSQTTGATEH